MLAADDQMEPIGCEREHTEQREQKHDEVNRDSTRSTREKRSVWKRKQEKEAIE